MKTAKIILAIVFGCGLVACEDTIDNVDLDTAAPRLVIDASIDWEKGTSGNEQSIQLTTTTGYYETTFPTVSGATVTIRNSANTVFNFIETPGSGNYVCFDFEPVVGETYTLTINLNGETYTATETLIATPDIEDTIEQNNEGGMAGDEIEITYYYQDDGSRLDYYLYGITTNRVAFPQYEIEDDDDIQGNRIPVYYAHEDLAPGDVINIKLYNLSKRGYDYFSKLLPASGNDDSPFPTVPNPVRGNIVNQTNAANFPYGYFRLSEVSTKNYTVQ
ncbi:DUF4249 family protein [Flavobacterium sp.]|uniref:DUF4249 family protein n=1 Tax=Flavobacterium sp. TaxID=239 RepID=UPI0039E349DA